MSVERFLLCLLVVALTWIVGVTATLLYQHYRGELTSANYRP